MRLALRRSHGGVANAHLALRADRARMQPMYEDDDDLDFAITQAIERGGLTMPPVDLQKKREERKQKQHLKLQVLKQLINEQVAVEKGQSKTMITQTRMQEEKSAILDAKAKQTPEQHIKAADVKQQAKQDSQEYIQDIG